MWHPFRWHLTALTKWHTCAVLLWIMRIVMSGYHLKFVARPPCFYDVITLTVQGLSARFERGNILQSPDAGNPSGFYVRYRTAGTAGISWIWKWVRTLRPAQNLCPLVSISVYEFRMLTSHRLLQSTGWWQAVLHTYMLVSHTQSQGFIGN